MTTNERLNQDLISAVKAHDAPVVSILRILRAALKNAEIEKRTDGQAELTEAEVIAVLNKELKKIKDAQDLFAQGGREDLVQNSKREIEVIERYLPKQLSEDELREEVKKVVAGLGEVSVADFGRVMKEVMKVIGGQADGAKISAIVKECIK